jgi:hypothetical protein
MFNLGKANLCVEESTEAGAQRKVMLIGRMILVKNINLFLLPKLPGYTLMDQKRASESSLYILT